MKNRYSVCHDSSDQKRLRLLFRKLRSFGNPVHYSVFVCDLSEAEKTLMITSIMDIISVKQDRVLTVKLSKANGKKAARIEIIGRPIESVFENPITLIV